MYAKLEILWRETTNTPTYGGYRIRQNAYSEFLDEFLLNYNEVKTRYMNNDVLYLDRYKVAAIIIFSMINIKLLDPNRNESDDWVIRSNQIALCAGLSYLQYECNQERIQSRCQPIMRYSFPQVNENTTSYLHTLIKLLFHIDTRKSSNVLAMAVILLSLEQYNLRGAMC